MAGHTPWSEIRAKRDDIDEDAVANERAKIEQEITDFEETLAALRRAQGFTQAQLASALGVSQPEISQLEKRTDFYLSTLASYIDAMDGELTLAARFGDRYVELDLGDLVGADRAGAKVTPRPPRAKAGGTRTTRRTTGARQTGGRAKGSTRRTPAKAKRGRSTSARSR
jgi:transcriptional regulator with XRE-family HTH domain